MEELKAAAPAARGAVSLLEEKLLHVLIALVLFLGLAIQRPAEPEAHALADWSILKSGSGMKNEGM